jgi:hypothetical protein
MDAKHPPHPVVLECLFGFEVLRRIGFLSSDIYAASAAMPDGSFMACVVLRTAGKQWIWHIAPLDMPPEKFKRLYEEAGESWNNLPPGDPWRFNGSRIDAMGGVAVASIVRKGIPIPRPA